MTLRMPARVSSRSDNLEIVVMPDAVSELMSSSSTPFASKR